MIVNINNGILVGYTRNEIMPFAATWMEIIILSEVRERKKPFDITYIWNLKYNANKSIYETETDSMEFLDLSPKAKATKVNMNTWDYTKLKSFCAEKKAIYKMKRQPSE